MIGFLLNTIAAASNGSAAVFFAFERDKWGAVMFTGLAIYWTLNAVYHAVAEA